MAENIPPRGFYYDSERQGHYDGMDVCLRALGFQEILDAAFQSSVRITKGVFAEDRDYPANFPKADFYEAEDVRTQFLLSKMFHVAELPLGLYVHREVKNNISVASTYSVGKIQEDGSVYKGILVPIVEKDSKLNATSMLPVEDVSLEMVIIDLCEWQYSLGLQPSLPSRDSDNNPMSINDFGFGDRASENN